MKDFFEKYISATTAGSGNQTFFVPEDADKIYTGKLYFKLMYAGEYDCSILFSNVIDSTYSDGSCSNCNMILDEWLITDMKAGVTKEINPDFDGDMYQIMFNGSKRKCVAPGEFFCSDDIYIRAEKDDYLCIKVSFMGKKIPNHTESLIPSFILENGKYKKSKELPFPGMIGCNRNVERKICFWGDSITQGIGTDENSYKNWCSVLSEMLGSNYAYWNLGIGFGRASDAASCGAWLYKAIHNDIAVVCFGVNDLLQGGETEAIKSNLCRIVNVLNKNKIKVILQTIPPFDYDKEKTLKWYEINDYIKTVLQEKVAAVFDTSSVLSESTNSLEKAKYGGHPSEIGCKIWADNLFPVISAILK